MEKMCWRKVPFHSGSQILSINSWKSSSLLLVCGFIHPENSNQVISSCWALPGCQGHPPPHHHREYAGVHTAFFCPQSPMDPQEESEHDKNSMFLIELNP